MLIYNVRETARCRKRDLVDDILKGLYPADTNPQIYI